MRARRRVTTRGARVCERRQSVELDAGTSRADAPQRWERRRITSFHFRWEPIRRGLGEERKQSRGRSASREGEEGAARRFALSGETSQQMHGDRRSAKLTSESLRNAHLSQPLPSLLAHSELLSFNLELHLGIHHPLVPYTLVHIQIA